MTGSVHSGHEVVVGLEVHAQLLTRTKAFCSCATSFGDPPNTHTCPVCLGLPGALPSLSEEVVRMAASAALALGCEVRQSSVFSRKNYFYPDLPKGYQITQYDQPLAVHGSVSFDVAGARRTARVLRVHIEEDAGKTVHGHGVDSVVDLNRAGTPLIEIVGEPDLRSGAEAAEYLKRLREILMFIGVNDGNLEQGSFRCDANVSVRKVGETALGTRTELKNINSFRFVADAIEVEARRQVALLESGERVRQQTRGYNPEKRETHLLRDKENESGYRYFPEPDLPPLTVDSELLREVHEALPPSADERRRRYVEDLGLPPQAAVVLTGHPEIAAFFEATVRLYTGGGDAVGPRPLAVRAANFIQSEVLRDVRTNGLNAELPVSPVQVAELLRAIDAGAISGKQSKQVYALMRGTKARPDAIIRDSGMGVLRDEQALVDLANEIIKNNPKQTAGYRSGKVNLLGFFVGLMMKATRGSADPGAVNRVVKRALGGEDEGSASAMLAASGASAANATNAPKADVAEPRLAHTSRSGLDAPKLESAREDSAVPTPIVASGPLPSTRLPEEPSPLAESVAPPALAGLARERTLTSAAAADAILSSLGQPTEDQRLGDALKHVDFRVGRILFAARLAGSDDALDLAVDIGEGPRPVRIIQSVGRGLAPEQLVGVRVIVVRVSGVTHPGSEARILVAGSGGTVALATVTDEMAPGAAVTASAPPGGGSSEA